MRWARGERSERFRLGTTDRGSGSILAVGSIAALCAATAIVLPFCAALPVKHRIKNAADAAALAAADVAVGLIPGAACEVAARVTDANGATLRRCQIDGLFVTVTAASSVLGLPIAATSSAGPAPSGFSSWPATEPE